MDKNIGMLNSVENDLEKLLNLQQTKNTLTQSSINKSINLMDKGKNNSFSSAITSHTSSDNSTMKGYLNSIVGLFKNEKPIHMVKSTHITK